MEEYGTNHEVAGILDATAFIGAYPFRNLAQATLARTRRRFASLGITRAVISPLEAIFQEDGVVAERELAASIRDDSAWIQFKTVNPMQAWWQEELREATNEFTVAGIRLFPLYHGYSLLSENLMEVFSFAKANDLPVQIFCRMQDVRIQHLLFAREAELGEITRLLERCRENRLLFSGLSCSSIRKLASHIHKNQLVGFDTSRLQGPWRTFEKLLTQIPVSRIIFGSLWPINLPECPLSQIKYAAVDEDAKKMILARNLENFFTPGSN